MPLILYRPMHTVPQQPARKEQQLTADVHTEASGSVRNIAPRRSNDSRVNSLPKPNHFFTHNPRVPLHQLVQLARAPFRPTAATPNRNEQLSLYKNCVIMAAHNASQ